MTMNENELATTGEEHAVNEYEKALGNDDLPGFLAPTVRRQADEIRTVRDQVKALSPS